MSARKTNINFVFANILRKVNATSIGRKELIQLVMEVNQLQEADATRFVGRHIHQLKKKNLLYSEGERNTTRYVFCDALVEMLASPVKNRNEQGYKPELAICASSLRQEKDTLSAELKLKMGEVEAFQDYMAKFPEAQKVIADLLNESRDSAALLYGRLNAIQKIIDATSVERASAC
ncbi:hypothetical protein [Oceanospirillum sanctuarii]|uniref:hypothetical protein n=1 Tax=Oceanospirillum sanctuarii TaxID=1434821 RepID=UPI000A3A8432|nr:hypothetical protein [Oceanospirillum sanctuarii]